MIPYADRHRATVYGSTPWHGGITHVLPVTLDGGTVTYPDGQINKSVWIVALLVHVDAEGSPVSVGLAGTELKETT